MKYLQSKTRHIERVEYFNNNGATNDQIVSPKRVYLVTLLFPPRSSNRTSIPLRALPIDCKHPLLRPTKLADAKPAIYVPNRVLLSISVCRLSDLAECVVEGGFRLQ